MASPEQRMLRIIESEMAFTRHLIGKDAFDARLMAAMELKNLCKSSHL